MLESITIKNYKSIEKLEINLGLINVFIGENGAGKSNILEAIALAGAAEANKLDNEFLTARGIRVTSPQMMRSAFKQQNLERPIEISVKGRDGAMYVYTVNNDNKPYSSWMNKVRVTPGGSTSAMTGLTDAIKTYIRTLSEADSKAFVDDFLAQMNSAVSESKKPAGKKSRRAPITISMTIPDAVGLKIKNPSNTVDHFVVYSPENSALRLFEREGQIEPLGINGEGLLKLLSVMASDEDSSSIQYVKNALKKLSWFDDFIIVEDEARGSMQIQDIFLDKLCHRFDQRSANEGFLFLAFYFALFSSQLTPKFFAVDNVDASLNPKLCQAMIESLVLLAKKQNKQAILTAHNPAVLDGLNLQDDDQRLFVVYRDRSGKTKVRRFLKEIPKSFPSRMSELFLRGAIGGLPKSF